MDKHLVTPTTGEIFELGNPVGCTVRGDIIRVITKLAAREERLDAVIIEAGGLTTPAQVALAFFIDIDVRLHYRLDAIVTLVDTRHIAQHWDTSDEVHKQIAFADAILLNKIDLVPADALDAIEMRIRQMNPVARLHRTQNAQIPLKHILNLGGFDLARAVKIDPQFMQPEYPFEWGGVYELAIGKYKLVINEGPALEMRAVIMRTEDSFEKTRDAITLLFSDKPMALPPGDALIPALKSRLLSFLSFSAVFPITIKSLGRYALFMQYHPEKFNASLVSTVTTPPRLQKSTREQTFKTTHSNDGAIASVSIILEAELDGLRFNAWLAELLKAKGDDIYRSKGVLAVHGSKQCIIFQGVHMLFETQPGAPWEKGEKRKSEFVFTGRNLNREELMKGVERCIKM